MKKGRKLSEYMATGGTATVDLAQAGVGLFDSILNVIENDPRAYSQQPTLNASTMRNMVTPYAGGGTIHIKKENRGKFTASANRAGMGVQAFAKKVLADPNASGTLKKRANFARNAASWKHAFGGEVSNVPVEVEDDEVLETPDGDVFQMDGNTHEEGGINIDAPEGTNVYSDRLQLDGESMQERKLRREKRVVKLEKLLEKNPTDSLLQSTYERESQLLQEEDDQDMAIQNAVGNIMNGGDEEDMTNEDTGEEFAYGGVTGGGGDDPFLSFIVSMLGKNLPASRTNAYGARQNAPEVLSNTGVGEPTTDSTANTPAPTSVTLQKQSLSLGDYLGLAGNAFNAIAPIVNTKNNAANKRPNVNRFLGFGHDALQTNETAQGVVAGLRSNALTDIDTATNTAYASNRNSARGISTLRALDAVTTMNKTKAQTAANSSYAAQLLGLLGQRGQLQNQKDQVVMQGEAQRDIEDKADTDNYYSNMAENLVNFGNNVQGIGKNLNTAKSNKVDSALLSQLSQYGLGFDKNGNLVKVR